MEELLTTDGGGRSRAGEVRVILSAAKDLGGIALPHEILRCAQDDGYPVIGYEAAAAGPVRGRAINSNSGRLAMPSRASRARVDG